MQRLAVPMHTQASTAPPSFSWNVPSRPATRPGTSETIIRSKTDPEIDIETWTNRVSLQLIYGDAEREGFLARAGMTPA